MANPAKRLFIGSIEPYSGKSGAILALAHQLQQRGQTVAYAKPLGNCVSKSPDSNIEEDVQFISQYLGLSETQVSAPLVYLDEEMIQQRLTGEDTQDYRQGLPDSLARLQADWIFIEAGGSLSEGSLFNLSLTDVIKVIDAPVLIVIRYSNLLIVDNILRTKQLLGSSLLGVLINDIPPEHLETTQALIQPFLESQGIAVLGMLPKSSLLYSVSVREIVQKLGATVLCRPDRLDLMVESLSIGAMNVNAALEYFRQGRNMAVVTGGDRSDLQLAALETSTNCLILTGNIPPDPMILSRAEDLEIPILSVNLDTLTTVEIVDQSFGKVRLQEKIKIDCIQKLMDQYFNLERFLGMV